MYRKLDEQSVLAYVQKASFYKQIFGDSDDLKSDDLAEGNINLIFRVYSASDPIGKSVLVKQALPHSRRYPQFKIPLDRARIEYKALQLEANRCPQQVPRVYSYDPEMHLNIMEDMNQHVVMRYGLMRQTKYRFFAEHIGTFLARTLFYTSDLYMSPFEKKAMVPTFNNPVLCKVTEDLVFTEPYVDHPNNRWTRLLDPQAAEIRSNEKLRSEVLLLKMDFMCKAQALVHGDLHTGSIMVNDEETKVIDPEFAYFGPMGFDIGDVLGNLALSYASQECHAKHTDVRAEYRQWLLNTIRGVWATFDSEFRRLWEAEGNDQWPSVCLRDRYLNQLLQDAAGFGACEMMRRILGLAHVPDFDLIEDEHMRAVAESLALNMAQSMLMDRPGFTSVEDLVSAIKASHFSPSVA
jgi:5-methylthioribose kinase